jgi:hypothetical protein
MCVNVECMKDPLIALLTNDPSLEECVAQVLLETGGLSHKEDFEHAGALAYANGATVADAIRSAAEQPKNWRLSPNEYESYHAI